MRRETDLQTVADIRARLFALTDPAYGDFQAGLMPGIPREQIIGVRVPHLRALAKELRGTPAADAFLAELPHICTVFCSILSATLMPASPPPSGFCRISTAGQPATALRRVR